MYMSSFFSYLKQQRKFPSPKTFVAAISGPLTRASAFLCILSALTIVVIYALIVSINSNFLVTVPAHGGTATIGIIGTPRFLHPLLATTDTDESIDTLIYAGLMKANPDGSVIPELAEKYSLSPDGKNYTFVLRDKTRFHDGTDLTSADIAFTVHTLQDQNINPESSSYWQTINVETEDDHTIMFRLPAPDPAFLEKMTFGIISQKEWQDIPFEEWAAHAETVPPNGAGAFKVQSTDRPEGTMNTITLVRNNKYALGRSFLKTIEIKSFPNQEKLYDALAAGDVDITMALEAETIATDPLPSGISIASIKLPDTVGLYRLSNEPVLGNAAFTTIIDKYIDKGAILAKVDHGYGTLEESSAPSPSSLDETISALHAIGFTTSNGVLTYRNAPVGFSIAVENDEERLIAARELAGELGKLGMIITVKAFDQGAFQDVIQSNAYGVILTASNDIASKPQYHTALVLYQKTLPYVTDDIYGVFPTTLSRPVLRYANALTWYTLTDKLWPGLVKKTEQ
jgi:peptide/nickel transport system substrate-binding protein